MKIVILGAGQVGKSVAGSLASESNDITVVDHDIQATVLLALDPLQVRWVQLGWVNAVYEWNTKIKNASPAQREIFVMQGDRDTTVDHQYNVKFVEKKFNVAQAYIVKDAEHELFNETERMKAESIGMVLRWLNGESKDE